MFHLKIALLSLSYIYLTYSFSQVPQRRVFCGQKQDFWVYPFNSQVNLRYKFSNGSTESLCGGVFVHKSIVLTVNSCFDGLPRDAYKNVEIRYGGVTYDSMIHYRFAYERHIHPRIDATLLVLNAYATEDISYFDYRFWNVRPYQHLCKTYVCGYGITNKTDENHQTVHWDSGKMFCVRYAKTMHGSACGYVDEEYKEYTDCHFPVAPNTWEQNVHSRNLMASTCYHDKGTPIFMEDEDGYTKLKGISLFDANCGNWSIFPNHLAPDVAIQIEAISPWILEFTRSKFPRSSSYKGDEENRQNTGKYVDASKSNDDNYPKIMGQETLRIQMKNLKVINK